MCRVRISLFIIFLLSLTYFSARLPAIKAIQIDLTGQVSSIQDGNTFTINQGGTIIRLADIDVPGVYQRGYDQARSYLSDLIGGKTVYLDQSELAGVMDGRLICVVYIDYDSQNYLNVNKKVLESPYFTQVDNRNDFIPSTWTLLVPKGSTPPPIHYSLNIQPPDGSGTTNPNSGSYRYYQVVTVPVQASPASGWIFDHWLLDGSNIGSQNPYVVTMNTDHQLKAVFVAGSSSTSGIPGYPLGSILFGVIASLVLIISFPRVCSIKRVIEP